MSSLYLALDNFKYHIGLITPTDTTSVQAGFEPFDIAKATPQNSSGWARKYWLTWTPDKPIDEVESLDERHSHQIFTLSVVYPLVAFSSPNDRQAVMMRDRGDLLSRLRHDDQNVGISSAFPTQDIGLWDRRFMSDSVARYEAQRFADNDLVAAPLLIYRQIWRTHFFESEV